MLLFTISASRSVLALVERHRLLTLADWHLGEIASCQATVVEAISLAKKLNDPNALAIALGWAATLAECERNPAEVDHLVSELIELSARHNLGHWLPVGAIYRGWARCASGNTAEGIAWIEQGIRDSRATGSVLGLPYFLGTARVVRRTVPAAWCVSRGHGSGYANEVRAVPAWLKRQAYAEYKITQYKTDDYEVDHLIPLSLGGSNI